MQALGPVLMADQVREANLQPHLLNIGPTPDHLESLTGEPRQLQSPSYRLALEGNEASSPIQLFSASNTPSPRDSELGQWLHQKIELIASPTCPVMLLADTSRNPNYADW